jgi:Tetratricopeptide repeat
MSTTSHSPALWTLGIAALTLSGFSLWSTLGGPSNSSTDTGVLDDSNTKLTESLAKIEDGQTRMLARIETLKLRLDGLENNSRRTEVSLSNATGTAADKTAQPVSGSSEGGTATAAPAMDKKEFAALLEKMFRTQGAASEDEQAAFWKLARTTTMIDDHIKDLRAAVKASPGDPTKKLALADAYVAKLMTVPDGPERGLYAVKAESQWKNILKMDPAHWEAQISLAFSHSQYPDFLNMTGEAVKDFEKVLTIQERVPQDKKHAVTYSQLAILYRKQGKKDKALTLLREGNRRFPKDASILKLLGELQGN